MDTKQSFWFDWLNLWFNLACEKPHLVVLGSVGSDNAPELRHMVLRRIDDEMRLIFVTDSRSAKSRELHERPAVALCIYDWTNRRQLRLQGKAELLGHKDNVAARIWHELSEEMRRSFHSGAPASIRPEDELLHNHRSWIHDSASLAASGLDVAPPAFSLIRVSIHTADLLALSQFPLLRRLERREGDVWTSQEVWP